MWNTVISSTPSNERTTERSPDLWMLPLTTLVCGPPARTSECAPPPQLSQIIFLVKGDTEEKAVLRGWWMDSIDCSKVGEELFDLKKKITDHCIHWTWCGKREHGGVDWVMTHSEEPSRLIFHVRRGELKCNYIFSPYWNIGFAYRFNRYFKYISVEKVMSK